MAINNNTNRRFDPILRKLRWRNNAKEECPTEDGTTKVEDNNKLVLTKEEEQQQEEEAQQVSNIMQSPTSMALLFILTLEAILIVVMESFVIYYHSMIFAQCIFSLNTLGLSQADLIYHGIFIATPIYQLLLYIDTLRQRNIFQLFTLLLFGVLMVISSGIQTIQHMIFEQAGCNLSSSSYGNATTFPNSTLASNATSTSKKLQMLVIINGTASNFQDNVDTSVSNIRPFEYSILAIIAVGFIVLLGCSVKLYHLFKWRNYFSHHFTDNRLRNTLISWAILTGLLKIDFFYIFAYAVQLVPAVLIGYTNIPAFECLIVFAVGLIAFLLAIYSIRNENMITLMMFNTILLGSIGYFGYRLFTFGIPRDATSDPFLLTRYSLLFTTLTLTLLMILTLCTSLVCVRNVWLNKMRILDKFQCICPTCYMHSSLVPSRITSDTATTSATATPARSSSVAVSCASNSMKKASSLDLEIVNVK